MKPRVVLDSNIYLSAILFGGRPEEVFLLAKESKIDLYVSTAIIAEVAAKLTDKFLWSTADVTDVVKEIGDTATVLRPIKRLTVIEADKSDNRILECAVATGANFVVSGDRRHLLAMKSYAGIRIITCAGFLRKMGKP